MTPSRSGCPASSELISSSRSQVIPDEGVNDGAYWPLFALYTLHSESRERWGEGSALSHPGAQKGGGISSDFTICQIFHALSPAVLRQIPMIPKCHTAYGGQMCFSNRCRLRKQSLERFFHNFKELASVDALKVGKSTK